MSISLSRATEFISGSSDRVHPFTFEWQDKEHIQVYLNGVALTQDDGTSTSNFSISGTPGAAQVNLGTGITLATDDVLIIQRETPAASTDSPVQWTPGPLKSRDLVASTKHQLYRAQENLRSTLDLGASLSMDSVLSGAVPVDSSAVTTAAAFLPAAALATSSSDTTVIGSPAAFTVSASGVRFLVSGTYEVEMVFEFAQASSGLTARLGFDTAKANRTFRTEGSNGTEQVHASFLIPVTSGETLQPFGALGSGSATQTGLALKIRRFL